MRSMREEPKKAHCVGTNQPAIYPRSNNVTDHHRSNNVIDHHRSNNVTDHHRSNNVTNTMCQSTPNCKSRYYQLLVQTNNQTSS